MFLASVVYISLTALLGIAFANDETKVTIEYLDPDKGTEGYDLFYYDGESLRDEKWRFDPKTGSTVVSRRNGFREMDNFHLVDATLDALGSFTKSYRMKNEKDLIKHRVKEPHTSKEVDNMNDDMKSSNEFTGVSINTQYSNQNGNSHVSNVVGIQHLNPPSLYNGLNFQQAFSTPGFGFQQQGSLYNHQPPHFSSNLPTFPNNHNFQIATFLMPFFNQHNHIPNQHQTLGSFPAFGIGNGQGTGHVQVAATAPPNAVSTTIPTTSSQIPDTPQVTELPALQSTVAPTVKTTTQDPTFDFDIRAVQDGKVETNVSETQNIQTTSRRTIEGLPSSDEEEIGGVLDDKINSNVLKTLVG